MNAIALACIAALGLLLFGLGLSISGLRFREQTLTGHSKESDNLLHKVVRAHGNTAEYAAFIAVLFLYLGSQGPAPWVVWVMVALTVSRYIVVAGLIVPRSMDTLNPLRFIGALGTYVFGAVLCFALVGAV